MFNVSAMPARNLISKKKEVYGLVPRFKDYLHRYNRLYDHGIRYEDLLRYDNYIALYDETGTDTLWSTVFYPYNEMEDIHRQLRMTYAILKAHGDMSIAEHLYIERVDLCLYGNT